MPRIFWTKKRKALLIQQAKTMTVEAMAKHHFQPRVEIERMLAQLSPERPLVMRTYREKGHTVTVYYPGYAFGVCAQRTGSHHSVY